MFEHLDDHSGGTGTPLAAVHRRARELRQQQLRHRVAVGSVAAVTTAGVAAAAAVGLPGSSNASGPATQTATPAASVAASANPSPAPTAVPPSASPTVAPATTTAPGPTAVLSTATPIARPTSLSTSTSVPEPTSDAATTTSPPGSTAVAPAATTTGAAATAACDNLTQLMARPQGPQHWTLTPFSAAGQDTWSSGSRILTLDVVCKPVTQTELTASAAAWSSALFGPSGSGQPTLLPVTVAGHSGWAWSGGGNLTDGIAWNVGDDSVYLSITNPGAQGGNAGGAEAQVQAQMKAFADSLPTG